VIHGKVYCGAKNRLVVFAPHRRQQCSLLLRSTVASVSGEEKIKKNHKADSPQYWRVSRLAISSSIAISQKALKGKSPTMSVPTTFSQTLRDIPSKRPAHLRSIST
jgi:hypothetical protein